MQHFSWFNKILCIKETNNILISELINYKYIKLTIYDRSIFYCFLAWTLEISKYLFCMIELLLRNLKETFVFMKCIICIYIILVNRVNYFYL